jgi:uncharacterized membrane protein
VTLLAFARWLHLVAGAVWVGGLLLMGPLVFALRRAGADREQLRAAARAFAVATWTAMAVAVATGVAQVVLMRLPWTWPRLQVKIALVAVTCAIVLVHQLTARRAGDRVRRVLEVAMLLTTLGIVAAAVAL